MNMFVSHGNSSHKIQLSIRLLWFLSYLFPPVKEFCCLFECLKVKDVHLVSFFTSADAAAGILGSVMMSRVRGKQRPNTFEGEKGRALTCFQSRDRFTFVFPQR